MLILALIRFSLKSYIFLSVAIILEVFGTLLLPASQNFSKIIPTVTLVAAYVCSFYFLTFALKTIPIAVVYASWAGLGIFLIAVMSKLFFDQSLSWQVILGLIFIIAGVVLVNTFSDSHGVEQSN
jgi:small multidrug resistance pump